MIVLTNNDLGSWQNGCDGDFCYITLPVDITANPTDIFHKINECSNNEACIGIIMAAVAAAGGDPSVVAQYSQLYSASYPILRGDHGGNETHLYLAVPEGYFACQVKWNVWSVTPGSTISATFRNDRKEIALYANVPVNGLFEGRSWLKSQFEFEFRRDQACSLPAELEANGYGDVYMNGNDPSRPHVNAPSGDSRAPRKIAPDHGPDGFPRTLRSLHEP